MTAEPFERPPQERVRAYRELLQFDSVTCALSDCIDDQTRARGKD